MLRGKSHNPTSSVGGWSVNSSHRQAVGSFSKSIGFRFQLKPINTCEVFSTAPLHGGVRHEEHGQDESLVGALHVQSSSKAPANSEVVQS